MVGLSVFCRRGYGVVATLSDGLADGPEALDFLVLHLLHHLVGTRAADGYVAVAVADVDAADVCGGQPALLADKSDRAAFLY